MDWILLMPVLIPVIGALSLIAMRFYFPKQSVLDGTPRFKRAVRIGTFCFAFAAGRLFLYGAFADFGQLSGVLPFG